MNYFDVILEMQDRLRVERNEVLKEIRLEQQAYRDFYQEVIDKMNFITMSVSSGGISCISLYGINILPAQQTEFQTKEHIPISKKDFPQLFLDQY